MKPYNGFDGAQRQRALAWANKQYANGTRPRAKVCDACGQDKGVIDRHSEDYSEPFGPHIGRFGLCYTCHMMVHCRYGAPASWRAYKEAVNAGATFAPLFIRNFPAVASAYLRDTLPEPVSYRAPPARRVLDEIDSGEARAAST